MFQWRSKVSALWLHARTELHDGMWSLYTETLYSSVHSTSVCFKIQTKKIQRRQKRNGCEIISCPQAATQRPHLKLIIQYIYNYTLFDCQHDEWNDLWDSRENGAWNDPNWLSASVSKCFLWILSERYEVQFCCFLAERHKHPEEEEEEDDDDDLFIISFGWLNRGEMRSSPGKELLRFESSGFKSSL